MPIYEYKCEKCEVVFDILHKSSTTIEEVVCPKCQSNKSKKLFSTFAASIAGANNNTSPCSDGGCGVNYSSPCSSGMCGVN